MGRRKRLLSEWASMRIYQFLLVGGFIGLISFDILWFSADSALAYTIWFGTTMLRLGLGMNKYLVWSIAAAYMICRKGNYAAMPDWAIVVPCGAAFHFYMIVSKCIS